MNRLDGDAAGPVKVLVSNPLYSHDHQHVIIPEGTVVLGEAKKIGSAGFGQQRRMTCSRTVVSGMAAVANACRAPTGNSGGTKSRPINTAIFAWRDR
jgi:hypothetical protein